MTLFLLLRMICRKTGIAVVVFCILGGVFGGLQFVGLFGPSAAAYYYLIRVNNGCGSRIGPDSDDVERLAGNC